MDNMEELQRLLSPILEDPHALDTILSAAQQMGLSADDTPPESEPDASGDMMSALGKFAPLLAGISGEDDTTRLLSALHPFLKGERGKKLENAQRMVSFMRVMNALKDSKLI